MVVNTSSGLTVTGSSPKKRKSSHKSFSSCFDIAVSASIAGSASATKYWNKAQVSTCNAVLGRNLKARTSITGTKRSITLRSERRFISFSSILTSVTAFVTANIDVVKAVEETDSHINIH